MKATTNHTTDLDVNIKKKPTPETPPRAEAWYAVMGGVLFLILTLVLVVILAWVHWGTGMCFLNNGAGFVPRVPDASAWDALSEAAKLVSNVNQTAYGFGYSGCRLETAHRFLPDQGGWWYYWRLPISTPTTRTFVWVSYATHQISAWWTQYAAQSSNPGYSPKLRWFNVQLLAIHGLFHLLHLLQTHTTCAAAAQFGRRNSDAFLSERRPPTRPGTRRCTTT